MIIRTLASGAAIAMLAGCATPREDVKRPPTDPVAWSVERLVGSYDNFFQYSEAPDALKVPPSVGGRWLDRKHAVFRSVKVPALGPNVVYLEWRSDGPTGPISRQRLWQFRLDEAGQPRMDFYTIRKPERLAGAAGTPEAFQSLTRDDLVGYPAACAARVTPTPQGWTARILPAECSIVAGSGRTMALDVTIRVEAATVSYQEAGLLPDGAAAFRVPPERPYLFARSGPAPFPLTQPGQRRERRERRPD
jgi:hypothetical protein